MIQLIGGDLYQWDVRRSVVFTPEGTDAEALHFAHQGDSKAVIMELVDSQARIPDYLLQSDKALCVYAVSAGVTFEKVILPVRKRERPENYVYEDDRRNYIYELIQAAKDAVDDANTVVAELRTARDSGEFDGPQGDPGSSGVYVLGEGETEADVPEDVNVLIDPNGDPLDISQPLTVTVTDGVANHTAREIIDHILAGGTAMAYMYEDSETYVYSFDGGYFLEGDETDVWVVFRCGSLGSAYMDQLMIENDGRATCCSISTPTHSEVLSLINKQLGVIENGSY